MLDQEEIVQEGLQVEMTCNREGSGEEGGWEEKRQRRGHSLTAEMAVRESSEEGQFPRTETRN